MRTQSQLRIGRGAISLLRRALLTFRPNVETETRHHPLRIKILRERETTIRISRDGTNISLGLEFDRFSEWFDLGADVADMHTQVIDVTLTRSTKGRCAELGG